MRHLDEATILSVRDGAPVDQAARAHLEQCATCQAALDAASERTEAIERTLTALDRPIEPTAAKAGVRARVREVRGGPARSRWSGWHLGRAAALLLLTAGAAAALPGSPLRSLWVAPDERIPPTVSEDASVETAETTTASGFASGDGVGIAVAVRDSTVYVVVRGAVPGTELSVTWTNQTSARVVAPAGSRFTYSDGRVEVDASRGAIRIELPRHAGSVSLEVDGQLYLKGSPAAIQVMGPLVEQTEGSLRFRVADG